MKRGNKKVLKNKEFVWGGKKECVCVCECFERERSKASSRPNIFKTTTIQKGIFQAIALLNTDSPIGYFLKIFPVHTLKPLPAHFQAKSASINDRLTTRYME